MDAAFTTVLSVCLSWTGAGLPLFITIPASTQWRAQNRYSPVSKEFMNEQEGHREEGRQDPPLESPAFCT